MLSLFDQTEPVPEKAASLKIYKGTLEELLVYLAANPNSRGKYLSDNESAFQMEARAEEIFTRLKLPEKAYNLGFSYYAPTASPAFLGRGLNNDANRFLPQDYVVVTQNEKWASLWGELELLPKVVGMKTVQEGSLADAYKRALDTANTTAIYVSYEDIEAIHAGVEQVCVDLEHSEEQLQDVLDNNNSTVILISFEQEDTLEEIVATVRSFLEGEDIRAVVSPHHEIVKAVKESFNEHQA